MLLKFSRMSRGMLGTSMANAEQLKILKSGVFAL